MAIISEITKEIAKVMHPAINYSLVDLGMVQDIELYTEQLVILTFVFPFPNIPIADKLIASVEKVVQALGFEMQYIVRVMKTDEKQRFLQMEKAGWKGGKASCSC
ncbi:iron-sulfur cluster assembly protein [uncultured Draconibacterium sp.]|uniref:iron-sulfur cluster assembly protein n=1 Tax=uncultured Draconibacterium sp. TaxID=1573823 RepID=UPI0025E5B3BC|nr:iron-sulfur cluster assembly protein [uncultured Draconibacterium sp.]